MTTPDVRVRLSAEGVSEVVGALRKIESESARASKSSEALGRAVGALKTLLPAVSLAVVTSKLGSFAKATFEAADAISDASKRIGVSGTELSRLAYAASQADVDFGELTQGIKKFLITLSEAQSGSKPAIAALAAIGVEASQLQGLKLEDQLAVLADGFQRIRDPADRTRIAVDLFGKSGEALIPLLAQGSKGLREMTAESDKLGKTLSESTLAAVDKLDEATKRLGGAWDGFAATMLSKVAPSLSVVLNQLADLASGSEAGKLRRQLELLKNFEGRGGLFVGAGNGVEVLNAKEVAARRAEIEKRLRVLDGGQAPGGHSRQPTPLEFAPTPTATTPPTPASAPRTGDTSASRLAAEKAAIAENIALEEAGARELVAIRQQLLQVTGQDSQARIEAIDAEIAGRRKTLELAGMATEQALADLAKLRDAQIAAVNFDDLEEQARRAMQSVAAERQKIENEVALGLKTQAEGQAAIAAIEAARLPVLQQIALAAQTAAAATNDPAALERSAAMNLEVQTLEVNLNKTGEAFANVKEGAAAAAASGMGTLLMDVASGAVSAGEGMRQFAAQFATAVAQMIAQAIALAAVKAALRAFTGGLADGGLVGGGAAGYATGGRVSGPGTGTSDSIPAWLSAGEFVVRSSVVAQPGVLDHLQALNANMQMPMLRTPRRRFAAGGLAVAAPTEPGGRVQPVRIINVTDPKLVHEAMNSSSGEKVIMNTIRHNKAGIKRLLG